MKMKFLWFIIVFHISEAEVAPTPNPLSSTIPTVSICEKNVKEFIQKVENLVLNTTKEALKVTKHIYRNLTTSLPFRLANVIVPITNEYTCMVEKILEYPSSYSEQRNLLRRFRYNNRQIERLRQQLIPEFPKFEFHLISHEFYYTGKNLTEFDNLYLKFMLEFQRLSQTLWSTISAEVVEEHQDLLEILDEISKEKELRERDELYDEFIEMFLFKSENNAAANRQLE